MKAKQTTIPIFKTESEEADWWASRGGRAFVKKNSAASVAAPMPIAAPMAVNKDFVPTVA